MHAAYALIHDCVTPTHTDTTCPCSVVVGVCLLVDDVPDFDEAVVTGRYERAVSQPATACDVRH